MCLVSCDRTSVLNDRGTPNEVRKSPFTEQDLLTFKFQDKDQPVCQPIKPFIIYKMKDNTKPSAAEKAKYNKDVIVTFQKCGVIDADWMVRNYLPNWGCPHPQRRFAIYDSEIQADLQNGEPSRFTQWRSKLVHTIDV